MINLKFFISHIILILLNFSVIFSAKQMKFVFELFRHGARSPIYVQKPNTDIFGNVWSGEGELTPVGMRQHFLLGYRNSEIYGKALKISKYSINDIYITSTNLNRTIMSAYSQLQGFFPPSTGIELTPFQELKADPPIKYDFTSEKNFLGNATMREKSNIFPIRVMNPADHEFYLHDYERCKGVQVLVDNGRNTAYYKNFSNLVVDNYGEKIYNIIGKTQQNFNLSEVKNIHELFDSFICGYFDGRSFPAIAKNDMKLETFYNLALEYLWIDLYVMAIPNEYVGLMSMSPLFTKILDKMKRRIDKDVENDDEYTNEDPKIHMVSGHDTNIAAFMVFLKAVFNRTDLLFPSFASSVYVELFYDAEVTSDTPIDKYFVNVMKDGENLFNESLNFTYFNEKIRQKLITKEEINNFCGFLVKNPDYSALIIINIIVTVIAVILFCWFLYLVMRKRNPILDVDETQPIMP